MTIRILNKALAALALMTAPALADWAANPITLGTDGAGATGTVDCAAGGTPGTIWGTGTYTSDSSICTAAMHFGWITQAQGGRVSYRQVPGLDSYQGASQNGVTSLDYGSWTSSFQVTGVAPLSGGAGPVAIDWSTSLDSAGYGEDLGATHTFLCPPGGNLASTIWGTDVYTSDSPICVAATHRGVINATSGGPVNVLVLGTQPSYSGTPRNGVTSTAYPSWDRSYVFQ